VTATSDSNPPDGNGYDALIFDWDGTLVDFRVKFFCSAVVGARTKEAVLGAAAQAQGGTTTGCGAQKIVGTGR